MTPSPTLLRNLLIIATCLLFQAAICNGQSSSTAREIYNKDFKWKVSIPEGFELVPDTAWTGMQNKGAAAVEKTYDMKVENQAKTIFVFRSDQFNYFESNYQPFDSSKDGNYLETYKGVDDVLYGTFKAQMPDARIDSSFTTEIIGGLEFYVFNVNIHINEAFTLHLLMYSRLFGKKEFTVNIMYVDAAKGKSMLEAWKASTF